MPRYLPALLVFLALSAWRPGWTQEAPMLTVAPAPKLTLNEPWRFKLADSLGPPRKHEELPSLATMHQRYIDAFVGTNRFGVSRVVTMEERNFQAGFLEMDGMRFLITRVQLVGLLQHPTPVVYVTNHARMDGSAHRPATEDSRPMVDSTTVPTRPLNDFEKKALNEIQLGNTRIVVGASEAVGALTATASCLGCHDVKSGTLLGAFSYGMEPVPTGK